MYDILEIFCSGERRVIITFDSQHYVCSDPAGGWNNCLKPDGMPMFS